MMIVEGELNSFADKLPTNPRDVSNPGSPLMSIILPCVLILVLVACLVLVICIVKHRRNTRTRLGKDAGKI